MAVTWQGDVGTAQMSPDDMWRQAQAEYEARAAAPRNDAFGRTLQADTPDALREELFAPLQEYAQALVQRARPVAAERPFQFHADPFGELVQFNPNSGQAKVLRQGRPTMGQREKIDYQDLLRQRNTLLGKNSMYFTAADRQKLADLEKDIKTFSQPQSDPFSQDFGQPFTQRRGFIGTQTRSAGGFPTGENDYQSEAYRLPSGTSFAGEENGDNMFQPQPSQPVSKVQIANQIAKQHPDWTKAQIIAEVKRQGR